MAAGDPICSIKAVDLPDTRFLGTDKITRLPA